MDEQDLKQLFDFIDVPAVDENKRKETLNLAVAEFEKSEKNYQGSSFLSRLISRHPMKEREHMNFTHRKLVYGGMATACVALMVFGMYPLVQDIRSKGQAATEAAQVNKITFDTGDSSPQKADPLLRWKVINKQDFDVDKLVTNLATEDKLVSAKRASAPQMAEMAAAPPASADRAVASSVPAFVAPAPAPAGMVAQGYEPMPYQPQVENRDKFSDVDQNAVKSVASDPVSTFSIDVDTASYSFVRQALNNGTLPPVDAVRVEEMVNYFDYAYPAPTDKSQPFRASVVVKPSPWHTDRKLMVVGIKGYEEVKAEKPDSNLVFLIDTSGSMYDQKKLPLLKQSLTMLVDQLKPTDKVSIVVYAGSAGTVLPPTEVSNKGTILNAISNLQAGGGTAGAAGINLAYQLAESNFNKNAVNRVMLATDGDFNVGITDPQELKSFIERKRDSGIFLSVLGFGTGNYNDALMQELAQNGNGVAAYIDSLNEARKVLVQEAGSTLFPIAKDVKIQVEFNPNTVAEYRLVGYETRALKTEDFNNDKVDAGDIGSGHEVTAIYEITPVGAQKTVDDKRYAAPEPVPAKTDTSSEYGFVKIRYKEPTGSVSKLITTPVTPANEEMSPELKSETDFAVSVAGFAQLLKGGKYTGTLTYDDVIAAANAAKGADPFGYRAEFINLVYNAKTAAAMRQPQPSYPPTGMDLPQ